MKPPDGMTLADATTGLFVAVKFDVPEAGRGAVMAAFADRLGAVDAWPGFRGLQVWVDATDPCTLIMVSWWQDQECFAAYMRSADHRRSHQRILSGELPPRPRRFRRYEVVTQ